MALKLVTPPATEPVTLVEAKVHLRVDAVSEDALITSLITAAREYAETVTWRALITQTWKFYCDDWPVGDEILLPNAPLQSVASVKYKDTAGIQTTWGVSNYIVDTDSEPGRVVLGYGLSWPSVTLYPANPIEIEFTAGYGVAAAVPASIKQAMLLLIGHLYENREATAAGQTITEVPFAVKALLSPLRVWRW